MYSVVSTLGWSYVLVLIFVHLLNLDSTSDTFGTRAKADQLGLSFTGNSVVRAGIRALPPILPSFILEKKATLSQLLSSSKAFKLALKVYPGLSDSHHSVSRSPSYLHIIHQRTTTTFLRFGFTIMIVQSFTLFEVAYLLQQGLVESMKTTMWYLIPRSFLLWGIVMQFPEVNLLHNFYLTCRLILKTAGQIKSYIHQYDTRLVYH